ncbi:MAG: hypothetical protein Q8R74_12355 [Methylophilus sp.]|nr:hypothetical protein [Methylophilus sp.]
MNTLNLTVAVSSLILLTLGAAQAQVSNQNQFMAKRPYQAAIENTAQQKDVQWEGATLIKDEGSVNEVALEKRNILHVNMLSKRPY